MGWYVRPIVLGDTLGTDRGLHAPVLCQMTTHNNNLDSANLLVKVLPFLYADSLQCGYKDCGLQWCSYN